MLRLIGIAGKRGSGKTTVVAKHLIEVRGFKKISFADPIKYMLHTLGVSLEELWGSKKETPSELLGGKTPRHGMQTLGTEWGRDLIHEDIWVRAWEKQVVKYNLVVADDLRFPNEQEAIFKLGGRIILIDRPGTEPEDEHRSEILLGDLRPNRILINDGTKTELQAKVDVFMAETRQGNNAENLKKQAEQNKAKEDYSRRVGLPAKDWEPKFERGVAHRGISKLKI